MAAIRMKVSVVVAAMFVGVLGTAACEDEPQGVRGSAKREREEWGLSPGLAGLDEPVEEPAAPPARAAAPTGDPAVCARLRACCEPHEGRATAAGVACDLAPGVGQGDCAATLASVRRLFREHGVAPPPGCDEP